MSGVHRHRHQNPDGQYFCGECGAPLVAPPGRRAESWVALAAGLVTVGLLAAAGADIWIQLSRDAANQTTVGQSSTTPTATSATTTTPEPPTQPPSVVIASPCRPGSGKGVAADGSVTYCERLADTDRYLWSLNPGDIPSPDAGQGGDPAVGVCMVQTGRTEADCIEYLKPPSGPGN